jgi:hypothetical protein
LAEVFAIISAADPALGQIPQNQVGILHLMLNTAPQRSRKSSCLAKRARTGGALAMPALSAAVKTPWTCKARISC